MLKPRKPSLFEVVKNVLAQTELAGVARMQREIAQAARADGCILWEVAPGAILRGANPSGFLLPVTQCFLSGRVCGLAELPIAHSATGSSILSNQIILVDDVASDPRVFHDHGHLTEAQIGPMACVPLRFPAGHAGALNFYRHRGAPKFDLEDAGSLNVLGGLVPELYEAICNRVSLRIIQSIGDVHSRADASIGAAPQVFAEICNVISNAFGCVETSLFLRASGQPEEVYRLEATTWPKEHAAWFQKTEYRARQGEGLTGWVLEHQKPLRILDLASVGRDKSWTQTEHEGLVWNDSLGIRDPTRMHQVLHLAPDQPLPPLSYMGTPLVAGNSLLGVLRCCLARQEPHFFLERELNLLGIVASQMARYWSDCLRHSQLASAVAGLQNAEAGQRKLAAQQQQAFQDLSHQVRGPILQAHERVGTAILRLPEQTFDLMSQLRAIRGLTGKAHRVARNTDLFSRLAQGLPVITNRTVIDDETLVRRAIEAAMDSEVVLDPERNIRFSVERHGFSVVRNRGIELDVDLFDQALSTILDNAGKYSHPNTTVRVFAGLTGSDRFHVSVVSEGLAIRGTEVASCVERGWRGEAARTVTGEGSGIGLWLVNHILRAHGGELVVVPTTREKLTEVKLVFPGGRT